MGEEYIPLEKEEQLRAENDFIKMKLALERGAEFGSFGGDDLPPAVENEFLKNVMEYEEQAEKKGRITIFEKIGKPEQFRPVNEISEEEFARAWSTLSAYLFEHGISLDACSPNISDRELYRFTIEELFAYELENLNIPGMIQGFIYDEFHPDPLYESERIVTGYLLPGIFRTEPVNEYFYCLHDNDIFLNGKSYPSHKDVQEALNHFKSFFSKIELHKARIESCRLVEAFKVLVEGNYKALAIGIDDQKPSVFEGDFLVEVEPDEFGYWNARKMQIGNIEF